MTNLLPHEISGKKTSNQILVFLHGWPDTTALWDKTVAAFEKDYYILNISYPNFSPKETKAKGEDFEVIADRIKLTIDHVNDTKRKVVLVSHDWGAIFGYYVDQRYPRYISEMISLDVGAKFIASKPLIVFYQFVLIIGFIIGGSIGRFLTHFIMKFFKYWPAWANRTDSSWNYPYYYFWKKILLAGGNSAKAILPGYEPSCPVAFVWGTKKPVQFFSKAWTDLLVKNPKNEVHAVNSGHWIQKEQPNFVIDLILRRITPK